MTTAPGPEQPTGQGGRLACSYGVHDFVTTVIGDNRLTLHVCTRCEASYVCNCGPTCRYESETT